MKEHLIILFHVLI